MIRRRSDYKMDKIEILISNGTYNKNYKKITNTKFVTNSFYDPMDIVQVKYEMLKEIIDSKQSIKRISKEFGFSRTSFYKIKEAYESRGLSALIPQKTGPKKPKKLTEFYQEYIDEYIVKNPKASSNEVTEILKKDTGISINKRTVERYRHKKKHFK
jgi:transposase